jgi:hypothetical protein
MKRSGIERNVGRMRVKIKNKRKRMQGERKEKRRKPEHKLFSKKEAAFLVCQLFFQAKCNICSAIPR